MSALEGLRVVDFSINVSGPFASMILGDLGADVVKVERVKGGDDCRAWGPFWGDRGCYFLDVNRNKRSLQLDLKNQRGLGIARRLIESADVLLENFRPGVMERLSLGYDDVHRLNPRLVYCSISGFGREGPRSPQGGFDPTLQALSGMMLSSGNDGDPPFRTGPSIIDKGSSLWAAIGILAALQERAVTGTGRHVDVSLLGTAMSWLSYDVLSYLATGSPPARLGTAAPGSVPSQAFEVADGYVHVAVGNDRIWLDFCSALGRPELAHDERFGRNEDRLRTRAELVAILSPVFRTSTRAEWLERLSAHGVPCAPVNRVDEALDDEQVQYLDIVETADVESSNGYAHVKSPLNFANLPAHGARRPPALGEHTDEILREDLGLSTDEIDEMRLDGVVA